MKLIEYLPEITNSSSQIYNSAGTHSTSSEFLAIKPPSKAPAPTTIKPVPKVVPTIPTVAAAPINPPAPPTTSGESSLDNFSLDDSSTGNSILVFLFVFIYSKD